jgi:hypothetical protein
MKFDSARVGTDTGKGSSKPISSRKETEIKPSGEKPKNKKSNIKNSSNKKGDEIVIQD